MGEDGGEDGEEEAAGERRRTGDGRNMFVYDGGCGGEGGWRGREERSALTRGFGLEDKKHRQPWKNIYYRLVGLK